MSDHVPDTEVLHDLRALVTGEWGPGLGRKIAAIKIYRKVTGCTLKEGKDIIEDWLDFEPDSPSAVPASDGPTVRVRIAVGVDPGGDWNACGWKDCDAEEAVEIAVDTIGSGEARYWVTADLPIPQAVEVEGEVES